MIEAPEPPFIYQAAFAVRVVQTVACTDTKQEKPLNLPLANPVIPENRRMISEAMNGIEDVYIQFGAKQPSGHSPPQVLGSQRPEDFRHPVSGAFMQPRPRLPEQDALLRPRLAHPIDMRRELVKLETPND